MKPVGSTSPAAPPSPEVLELLERRAQRLQELNTGGGEETAEHWLAEFDIGQDHYAFELEKLRSVMPLRLISPVPLAPAHVVGLVRYQGEPLTVFSLASLLGVRGWRVDPQVLLIVELGDGRLAAFDCEQVPNPVAVSKVVLDAARSRQRGHLLELLPTGAEASGRVLHLIDDTSALVRGAGRAAAHGD